MPAINLTTYEKPVRIRLLGHNNINKSVTPRVKPFSRLVIHHTLFHHKADFFHLPDVLLGIAGAGNDIGELAGFERAGAAGHAQEFGIQRSARLKRVDGLHPEVHQQVKFFGVAAVGIDGGIGADDHLHSAGDGLAHGGVEGGDGLAGFGGHHGGQVAIGETFLEAFGGHQGGNVVRAAGFHHVEGLVVEEAAMLDGIDAGADGDFGAARSVGVGGSFAAQGVRFGDDGVEFGLGELGGIDVVGEGEDAAGGAGLDDVGAVLDVVAHGLAGLVRATDDAVGDAGFAAEDVRGEAGGGVAMPAGGAEGVDGDQHARAGNLAGVDGVAQADIDVIAGPHVAHGGEAGHQGAAHDIDGIERALRNVLLEGVQFLYAVVALVGVSEVGVRVDQAGEQGGVAEIDGFGAGGKRRLGADGGDLTVGDHYKAGRDHVIDLAVEHVGGFEDVGLVGGG